MIDQRRIYNLFRIPCPDALRFVRQIRLSGRRAGRERRRKPRRGSPRALGFVGRRSGSFAIRWVRLPIWRVRSPFPWVRSSVRRVRSPATVALYATLVIIQSRYPRHEGPTVALYATLAVKLSRIARQSRVWRKRLSQNLRHAESRRMEGRRASAGLHPTARVNRDATPTAMFSTTSLIGSKSSEQASPKNYVMRRSCQCSIPARAGCLEKHSSVN